MDGLILSRVRRHAGISTGKNDYIINIYRYFIFMGGKDAAETVNLPVLINTLTIM